MHRVLILLALIAAVLATPLRAQEKPPYPAPPIDRSLLSAQQPPEPSGDDAPFEENEALQAAEEAARAATLRASGGPPQPVTLSAKITNDGAIIPGGLVWRIYASEANENGEPQLVERSELATAAFELSPGEYLIHAAYGYAQATENIIVTEAPQAHTLVLDAGALRLNAQITGEIGISPQLLSFDIFPEGLEDDGRSAIITDVGPGDLVHLNAGVYHVVSRFGDVNATVRTDLRVDRGQLTEATLFHDASQISLRLASEVGGEAIADVEWTITDAAGSIVFTHLGAFPSCVLAQGDYTVLARRGDDVFNRDFAVVAGKAQEVEVLTSF